MSSTAIVKDSVNCTSLSPIIICIIFVLSLFSIIGGIISYYFYDKNKKDKQVCTEDIKKSEEKCKVVQKPPQVNIPFTLPNSSDSQITLLNRMNSLKKSMSEKLSSDIIPLIIKGDDDLVISVADYNLSNGTNLKLKKMSGSSNNAIYALSQLWFYDTMGRTLRSGLNPNKCLYTLSDKIGISDCDGSPSQQWFIPYNKNSPIKSLNGMCVGVDIERGLNVSHESSILHDANIDINKCNDEKSRDIINYQKWNIDIIDFDSLINKRNNSNEPIEGTEATENKAQDV